MDPILISLISGLVGAIIGSVGTVSTVLITSRHETKRQRRDLVYRAALDEMEHDFQAGKLTQQSFSIPPLSAYVHYHLKLYNLLESGEVDREQVEKISAEWKEIWPYSSNGEAKQRSNQAEPKHATNVQHRDA